MVAQSLRAPEVRAKLHAWFSRYGGSAEVELEARVREVDEAKFEELLRKLRSNPHWSQKPVTVTSSDLVHASGVRETRGGPEGTSYLRKQKLETFDVFGTDSHHPVRLQASTERPAAADSTPLSIVRHKKRHTFVHKGLFKFELTEVKAGPSWETAIGEDSEYEVEVEYCGQQSFVQSQQHVSYLVDSFLGKARRARARAPRRAARWRPLTRAAPPPPPRHACLGAHGQALDAALVCQPDAHGAGRKRARDDDSLACGDVVSLAAGTAVVLEPVLAHRRPLQPELSAEQCVQMAWAFSAAEKGARRPTHQQARARPRLGAPRAG